VRKQYCSGSLSPRRLARSADARMRDADPDADAIAATKEQLIFLVVVIGIPFDLVCDLSKDPKCNRIVQDLIMVRFSSIPILAN
jgi:hypothetical protein